jgi:hypothetical protein
MAYVISSIETAPPPVYTPKIGASIDAERTQTPSESGANFQTLLKQSAMATPAPAATKNASLALGLTATPAAVTSTATSTDTAPGTIGTVTLGTPGPVINPAPSNPAMAPTAEALFGANPWINDAGGSGPNGGYSYNKYYFATPATAAKVAQMVGGKVVATNDLTPYGPFVQNQANQMVQMPDGRLINAGIIASYFDRGWSQQTVDALVNGETGGSMTIPT